MLTNSLVQQSLRRVALRNPSIFKPSSNGLMKLAAPASISAGNNASYRPVTSKSTKVSTDSAYSILANQRLQRPISPHLSIYQPQITWYPSMLNRLTGVTLSGGLYLFGIAYLVAPLFGWQLGSAALVAAFASLPIFAKVFLKAFAAFPFTFHSLNGFRHFQWDLGYGMKNQQVIRTGWTVVGLTAISTLALLFL